MRRLPSAVVSQRRFLTLTFAFVALWVGSGCLPTREFSDAVDSLVSSPPLSLAVATKAADPARSQQPFERRIRQGVSEVLICPVSGFTAIADNFGVPRGQGRAHEGIDMFGPVGLPVVAVVSGTLSLRPGVLGGLVARLVGNDDTSYFYGHLHSFEGTSRVVEQGDVIGYLGSTGNADGVPHLHFEIRPNRDRPVNPYPSVRAAC